jgi:hypothetical protein
MIDWYWILDGRASTRLIWMGCTARNGFFCRGRIARALACDKYTWEHYKIYLTAYRICFLHFFPRRLCDWPYRNLILFERHLPSAA